jgi:hypothetical protein
MPARPTGSRPDDPDAFLALLERSLVFTHHDRASIEENDGPGVAVDVLVEMAADEAREGGVHRSIENARNDGASAEAKRAIPGFDRLYLHNVGCNHARAYGAVRRYLAPAGSTRRRLRGLRLSLGPDGHNRRTQPHVVFRRLRVGGLQWLRRDRRWRNRYRVGGNRDPGLGGRRRRFCFLRIRLRWRQHSEAPYDH